MNLDEYLKQAKEQIRNTEIVKFEEKKNKVIEDCSGYYTLPCAKEPFEGEVIKLSGDEFYVMFQKYGIDEFAFRDKLERFDQWFHDKPTRVQQAWLKILTNKLTEN